MVRSRFEPLSTQERVKRARITWFYCQGEKRDCVCVLFLGKKNYIIQRGTSDFLSFSMCERKQKNFFFTG